MYCRGDWNKGNLRCLADWFKLNLRYLTVKVEQKGGSTTNWLKFDSPIIKKQVFLCVFRDEF